MFNFKLKLFICTLCSALLLVACSPPLQSAVFRSDLQHTGLYATSPLTKFHSVMWKFKASGAVKSSPVLANGLVYFGSDDGSLYAIDQENGELEWQFKTAKKITSTPAVDQGMLYFVDGDGYLYALNALDGTKKWAFATGGEGDWDQWDLFQSSPEVANGKVYFGSGDGSVYAVDALTGKLAWQYNTLEDSQTASPYWPVHSSPAVVNGIVYVGGYCGDFYALDAVTGKLEWKYATGRPVQSSPLVNGGLVYFGGRDDVLHALDAKTGVETWAYHSPEASWMPSSPAIWNDTLFVGSSNAYTFYAINALTGEIRWKVTSPGRSFSSPAVAGGVVYYGDATGQGAGVGHLYALDALTGNQLWSYNVPADVFSSPVVLNGVVYFTSMDGSLYALK
jgi:eukaryotic-like serine/threonine-protein kinase